MKNQEMKKFYKQAKANVIYMYDEIRKLVKQGKYKSAILFIEKFQKLCCVLTIRQNIQVYRIALNCINHIFEDYYLKSYVFKPKKAELRLQLFKKAFIILRKYKEFLDLCD